MTHNPSTHPTAVTGTRFRFHSVDILRGLVIVLMALDHIRDFWGMTPYNVEDIHQSSLAWFITRWVTHFCAPIFVFLAGTSVFFQLKAGKSQAEISRFLLTRGLWLIFLELTVIGLSWRFPVMLDVHVFQVIWILGVCMLLMIPLIRLPTWAILAGGLLIVSGHNAFDGMSSTHWLWVLLHQGGSIPLPFEQTVLVFYPLMPWPGVMMLGYVAGRLYFIEPSSEQALAAVEDKHALSRRLALIGVGCIAGFILLRVMGVYGDSTVFSVQDTLSQSIMQFLKVHKYPPSLQYLLVTLGGCFLLLALFEKSQNAFTRFFQTFGQVPMFFYILHLPLISLTAQMWTYATYGQSSNLAMAQMTLDWPPGYEASLLRVYLVWFALTGLFYVLCRAYGQFRRTRPSSEWWWRYL